MFESVLLFIVIVALSYGLYIRGQAKRSAAIIHMGDSIDYTMTIWAERDTSGVDVVNGQQEVELRRISAEYAISLVFAEEGEMREARITYAQSASKDFQQHLAPLLGQVNIGAIRFDPVHREDV
ncbi:MAG: hypothetical protein ACI8PG_002011 [Planctomycetota bacterium]|jgi:hypothetical protein